MGLVDRLLAATSVDRRDAGLVFMDEYQPVGGVGRRVAPPTFPVERSDDGPYLVFERTMDGHARSTVVIDQVQSQANRVEEALASALGDGLVRLPVFRLSADTPGGEIQLTSLDFPHRFADAYIRDSLCEGVRFDKSEVGKRLRGVSMADARPLFEREPYSLLFGSWDSHRKGRQVKFPRLYSSEMWGLDWEEVPRKAGKYDPLNVSGSIDDKANAEGDWKFLPPGDKKDKKEKGKKLSEIGHGHIAPNHTAGGGVVSVVTRRAWVSLAALARIRFGDVSADAAHCARATLLALALVGDRLAFGGPSVWLRSGCDLTKVAGQVGFEGAGGVIEDLEASVSEAIAAFNELRDRTAKAGIGMADDVVELTPTPQLLDAISFAVTRAESDQE